MMSLHNGSCVKINVWRKLQMVIAEVLGSLDEEIGRLRQVKDLLLGGGAGSGRLAVKRAKRKRVMSAEARERIAAAQRKRWAAQKKAAK
jgi:hypothetical protein